VVPK
jgi:hypothetical protein